MSEEKLQKEYQLKLISKLEISIIIPTFFRINFLKKKVLELEQIKNQEIFEAIFVLEHEDINSYKLIKDSKIKNVKIIYNFNEYYFSFKEGFLNSSGKYIIHMGDDDYFCDNGFKKIVSNIQEYPGTDWFVGLSEYVDENNHPIRILLSKIKRTLLLNYNYNILTVANFIMTPSVIINKSFLQKIGGFDTNFKFAQDYYCWLAAARLSKPKIINAQISKVTFSSSTFSGSFDFKRYIDFLKKILSFQKNKLFNIFQIFFVAYLVFHNFFFKKILNIFKNKFFESALNNLKCSNNKNSKQKILHITRFFDPKFLGGIEEGIIQLNKTAENNNFKNDIICTNKNDNLFTYENMNIIQCKQNFSISNNVFSISLLKNFGKIYKTYDLIHLHYPYPFADFVILLFSILNKKKIKLILTYHSDIVKQKFLRGLYLFFLKKFISNRVFFINISSDKYLKYSDFKKLFDKNEYFIQKIGLKDHSEFNEKFLKRKEILEFFNKNEKINLFIARDRHYKGIDTLIYLMQKNPDKNFAICTPNQKVKNFSINKKNILQLDSVNIIEKFFLLKKSYLHLFPSDNKAESFGITLVEAQMFSLPSIVYKINTGVNEIIKNNFNGIEVGEIDKKIYNEKFNEIYQNENLKDILSKNSRLNFLSNFSNENFDNYYSFLSKKLNI